MKKDLFIIVNEDTFLISHRLRIAEMAKEKGWNVSIVAKDTGKRSFLEEEGFNFIHMPVNPTGMNLGEELKLLFFLRKLLKNNPGAVIHLVGLKNMLWGGIAAKITGHDKIVFAVSGLGTLFGEKSSKRITGAILKILKTGIKGENKTVIFQNHEDEALFISNGICKKEQSRYMIGSGVSVNLFKSKERKDHEPIRIIFTGRMLREKGILDLIEAAEILRPEYEEKVEFILVGETRNNHYSLTKEELTELTDGRYIKWLGYRDDIPDLLAESDIMCFPSYYREGVPKALLEASAASLPIVTTDSIGCRDTVEDGVNGFLVKPHSPKEVARELSVLIKDPDLRKRMGEASLEKAERMYEVEDVAKKHLEIYESFLKN